MACHEMLLQQYLSRRQVRALDSTQSAAFRSAHLGSPSRSMGGATWRKMSPEEIRLAKRWYDDDGIQPSAIADRLGRSKSALTRLLVKQVPRKKQGRAPLLSEAQVDYLQKRLRDMVVKANAEHRVTVDMLRKSTKVKASCRVILEALTRTSKSV